MTTVILDRKLTRLNIKKNDDKQKFIQSTLKDVKDWQKRTVTKTYLPSDDNLSGTIYHNNYLEYLGIAWNNHYDIVFSPDILWYTLLCELAVIVKETPDKYSFLFTETPDSKQTITVQSDSLTVLPLDKIINELRERVPVNINIFLPEFETSTELSKFGQYAAFADMVSPYYDYSMYSCGIPNVIIKGNIDEYKKILNHWLTIEKQKWFDSSFISRVTKVLNDIVDNFESPDFWKNIFFLKRCGSGSDVEAFGWFTELFKFLPKVKYISNFSSHISIVNYKQLDLDIDYRMNVGVLSSSLNDGILEPHFGYIVNQKLKEPKIEPFK